MLSPFTQACLYRAGWFAGRKVSLLDTEKAVHAAGFELLECARNFLEEFDGLELAFPRRRTPAHVLAVAAKLTNTFKIGAIKTPGMHAEDYAKRIGGRICPIGELHGQASVFVDEQGRFYAAVDEFIQVLGATTSNALNSICEDREPVML